MFSIINSTVFEVVQPPNLMHCCPSYFSEL